MNPFHLFVAIALVFATSFLKAQDTIHVRIGDVFAPSGPELIDVPVYVSNLDTFNGFQFNILYDTSAVTLDSILLDGGLESYGVLFFNETEPGRLRVICLVDRGEDPYLVTGEIKLVTLRFLVGDKAVGVFPVRFGSDIGTVVPDGSNTRPDVTTQNGNIVLGSDRLQLAIPDSLVFGTTEPICIPLIGDYIPSQGKGRIVFTWDSTNIRATEVLFNENPLRLTGEMIDISPGRLVINNPSVNGDSLPAELLFIEILEICFVPLIVPGGSLISLDRDTSFFIGPLADTLFNYDILFSGGALSFQEIGTQDSVLLTIQGRSGVNLNEGLCLPVVAEAYTNIIDATLDVTWDVLGPIATPVEFDSVKGLHPQIDPTSFHYYSPIPREEILRIQWSSMSEETTSIARGDTLFEVCFTSIANCGTIKLSPSQIRPATGFNRQDEFTNRSFSIPHHITTGQILFGVDSVQLEMENARFGGGNDEFPVIITSQRVTAFSQGRLRIKYATDSLEFVSARILNGPDNAVINTSFNQEGEVNITLAVSQQAWASWEAGPWVELSFKPLVRPIKTTVVFLEDPIYGGTHFLLSKDNFPTFLPASLVDGSLTVDSPTAVEDQEPQVNALLVYPNPVSSLGLLKLSFMEGAGHHLKVEFLTITGQLIINSRLFFNHVGNCQFKLPTLPPGAYLLRVSTNQGQITQRVFLQ